MEKNNKLYTQALAVLYRDWVNNFATIDKFAEHYNITRELALDFITKGLVADEEESLIDE